MGHRAPPYFMRRLPLATAISAILAGAPVAHAATAADSDTGALEEITVTAQKQTENLQNVPIAIEAFDSQRLEQLNVVNLDDYVKYSPSVAYVRGQGQGGNGQPGSSHIYIRGVVSGGDGNHSGSQPSVGTYLDEQPVTTIDGTVDMHIYDVQRIEVLEGPQGTLYGASSESGTVRIITNKPDTTKFEGRLRCRWEQNSTRRQGLVGRRLRQHSAGILRGHSLGRLGRARWRLYQQHRRHGCECLYLGRRTHLSDLVGRGQQLSHRLSVSRQGRRGRRRHQQQCVSEQQLQYGRNARRPRGG